MEEILELLLDLIVERPIAGVVVSIVALSVICFVLTGSIVPIPLGVLIIGWVHWRISRYRVLTLGVSDKPLRAGGRSR